MKHVEIHKQVKREYWLEMLLGGGWQLEPAGGTTGDAFSAMDGERRLFLKCNSSPFLAVLSAEGIVPKLLWTKRLTNGDVITAQRWINGRKLDHTEMRQSKVASLLRQIHQSNDLLDMLKRMENEILTPELLLERLRTRLSFQEVCPSPIISHAFIYLESRAHAVRYNDVAVCHCDLHHNNWIMDEEEGLFLIDWDGASLADPALDLSILLYWYVPREEWSTWLNRYHLEMNSSLWKRIHWYVVMHLLERILNENENGNNERLDQWLHDLDTLMAEDFS